MLHLRNLFFLLGIFVLCLPKYGHAASADATIPITLGQAVVPLAGPWKFQTGDSPISANKTPVWADTNFDDATWSSMDLTPAANSVDPGLGTSGYVPGWTAKGHPDYAGYAWYRIRLHVDSGGQPLALLMPIDIDDGYQVYCNGRMIGGFGDFSGRQPRTYYGQPMMFRLPEGNRNLVLAIRFYMKPADLLEDPQPGGLHGPPQIGLAPVLAAYYRIQRQTLATTYNFYSVPILAYLLAALSALTLFILDRKERVFLWLGCAALLNVVYLTFVLAAILTTWVNDHALVFRPLLLSLVFLAWLMAWYLWFDLGAVRWLQRAIYGLTFWLILMQYLQYVFLGRITYPFFVSSPWEIASRSAHLLVGLLPIVILYFGIKRGREGWTAAPALLLLTVSLYPEPLVWLHIPRLWFFFGVQITTRLLIELSISFWVVLLLLRRFRDSQHLQQQMHDELRQAQQVQKTLLTDAPATLPGLQVECIYRPAAEVGGDFFQVLRSGEDALLVVLGDVSGKGLRAAMLVSLIVGTMRTLAEQELTPGQLLEGMNRRLHGRMEGGFATCVCARIGKDRQMTLANAGHLSPYLDNEELEVPTDLPLGIIPGIGYEERTYQVPTGARIVFLTDGIVEARNRHHELYGFERTKILVRRSSEEIAQTAQRFGQEDDITVVSLLWEPVRVPA